MDIIYAHPSALNGVDDDSDDDDEDGYENDDDDTGVHAGYIVLADVDGVG